MTLKTMLIASAALTLPMTGAFAQDVAPAATQAPSSATAPADAAAPASPGADAATSAPAMDASADATTAAPAAATAQVAAVTQADLKKGTQVMDTAGGSVGTIESVTADAAVVSTGKSRAQIPLTGFGKTDKGIVLGMTKAELEKAAGGAAPAAGS